MMKESEPTLDGIEDYNGKESKEKRLTVWIVILSGLLIGAIYTIVEFSSSPSNEVTVKETGIGKY